MPFPLFTDDGVAFGRDEMEVLPVAFSGLTACLREPLPLIVVYGLREPAL